MRTRIRIRHREGFHQEPAPESLPTSVLAEVLRTEPYLAEEVILSGKRLRNLKAPFLPPWCAR